ncbi:MAG: lysostaphin resistance A-like protein [Sarcina sp.]
MNFTPVETVLYIITMLLVGILEEIIFRGFLFKGLCKDSIKVAIIVSSLTFGFGHIINLFNGSGASLLFNICQISYAIAIGFLFVILFQRGKSLWPCIITHGIFNSLSIISNKEIAGNYIIPISIVIIFI